MDDKHDKITRYSILIFFATRSFFKNKLKFSGTQYPAHCLRNEQLIKQSIVESKKKGKTLKGYQNRGCRETSKGRNLKTYWKNQVEKEEKRIRFRYINIVMLTCH